MARTPKKKSAAVGLEGRVVETRGRRVLVRDASGERVCFLAGHRVVVGDQVRWIEVRGSGGKIVEVEGRETALLRVDARGREQVLAANLDGLLMVASAMHPPLRGGLIDRYAVAAGTCGLRVAVCLNKVDLGLSDEAEAVLALRQEAGMRVLRTSVVSGEGMSELRSFLVEVSQRGPWALVGHSGVGKTSLIGALLPTLDVGEVGEISAHWGTGQHTTTGSRIFDLGDGGEVVDSPGIRTFAPGGLAATEVRRHFPGLGGLVCRYRDCLHRDGEEGCEAEAQVSLELLTSYRRLLGEILGIEDRLRP
jgi:ribosome biogenesis GTPase